MNDPDNIETIRESLKDGTDEIYVNGFTFGIASSDIIITFKRNNKYVLNMNIPFGMAKDLANKLGAAILDFENSTDIKISTPSEVDSAITEVKKDET